MSDNKIWKSAHLMGVKGCSTCHSVMDIHARHCPLCGAVCHSRIPFSLQKTYAWLLTSIVLFVPANIMPVMKTYTLGQVMEKTILGGALHLWEDGSYFVSIVIIFASILVPLGKMLVLGYLCFSVVVKSKKSLVEKTRAYEITELLGKWSMIDVFVVMTLVTLVQLGYFMAIQSSPGILAFAGVVIATMMAAKSFDPRLMWEVSDNT